MPSNARNSYLIPLLEDAEELIRAHARLRTRQRGRQWGLGSLNRAAVVMCVGAWEAYLEELAKEAITTLRPPGHGISVWQSLNANARWHAGRLNNPNVEQTRQILRETLAIPDVTTSWAWQNTTPQQARTRLQDAISHRHAIAHGVNPRPTIHNSYTSQLPGFFRQLGRCTDSAVREYLVNVLGVANPWPT